METKFPARINWQDNPWLQARVLDLVNENLTYKEISSQLLRDFPSLFSHSPSDDAVRRAIQRIQDQQNRLSQTPEVEPQENLGDSLGEFIGLRTLYVDIEATNLGGAFGHMLCCSFADEYGNVETYRLDDPRFLGRNIVDDGPLAVAIRDKIETADVVVGHNFKLFDKPFINARLIKAGERAINSGLKILDSLYLVGGQNMRLGSRRLENVAKFLQLPVQKTVLDFEMLQLAAAGDVDAMNLIVEHCEHDVLVERLAFARIKQFVSVIHR